MKVCQLCAVDFTLAHFLLPLVDGMRGKGWDVTAICSDGENVPELRKRGYTIKTVSIARSMNPFAALRSTLALIRVFRRERFDLLHVHTPVAALIGRIAARVAGIPLVVYTAHGFYFHDEMPSWKRSLFVTLERFGGKFTDLLFSQSAEDVDEAVAEGIIDRAQVLAIGNGIDMDRFEPDRVGPGRAVRQVLGIPDQAFVVGFIGRLVGEKGIAELLAAAASLAPHYPQLWFLVVGERLVSDHAGGVEKEFAAAKAALGARLVTPGLRSDVPQMLAAMDLFCLPSWREGMPRTIIEAMAMAKPVLATDIRGSREEVVPEETGLLVPTKNPQRLVEAIERFIGDPAWAAQLGKAGRMRALELYDERKVVALQLRRLTDVASERGLLKPSC